MTVFAYATLAHGLFSGKIRSDQLSHVAEYLDKYAIRGYCCRENYERLRRTEQIAEKHGCSVAQAALAWVLAQPLEVFAELSASTPLGIPVPATEVYCDFHVLYSKPNIPFKL